MLGCRVPLHYGDAVLHVENSFTADCLSITEKIIIFLDSKRKMKSSVPLSVGGF